MRDNPMSKVPTRVLDDGTAIFDSRVIADYPDTLQDGRKRVDESGTNKSGYYCG